MTILTTVTSILIFDDQGITNTLSSDAGCSIEPNYRDGYEVGRTQGIVDQNYGKETMMDIMILRTSAEISRDIFNACNTFERAIGD